MTTWIRDWFVDMTRTGVYPGSFDPPTRAHLEIALAARDAHGLSRVDLAVSAVPLGKEPTSVPRFEERVEVIRASIETHDGLGFVVTDARLIVDIADGYDVVVMGADKWAQVNDPSWYGGDIAARDEAIARLPDLAIAPRPPHHIPDRHRLPVADDLLEVSSTAARAGRTEWMTDAARAFDRATGAWTEPHRYR
jgi:nicotinate-nucleotide adenylyltransferase